MISLLPTDILTYVYRLVHYDLIQKLNRLYNNSVIDMGTSDRVIERSCIRLKSGHFHPESIFASFVFNYRNGRDIMYSEWQKNIYNIKRRGHVAKIPKNYIHAPIYSN